MQCLPRSPQQTVPQNVQNEQQRATWEAHSGLNSPFFNISFHKKPAGALPGARPRLVASPRGLPRAPHPPHPRTGGRGAFTTLTPVPSGPLYFLFYFF